MKTHRKILLVSLICNFSLSIAKAQNIVLNPSFEEYYTLNYNSNVSQIDTIVVNWFTPINHKGTNDYYHINAADNEGRIPNNSMGFQDTCSGKAYVGFILYHKTLDNLREYITGKLTATLNNNVCYKVSFKYSLADRSPYTISNLGIYFSNSIPINNALPSLNSELSNLTYTPQIKINQWLYDKTNWTKVERFYLAQGNENYFTIGNFDNDDNTPTISVPKTTHVSLVNHSYIYIDDIHIEEVPLQSLPQINLGNDTILCKGEQIAFADMLFPGTVYVWNNITETSDSAFVINKTGLYWVEAYNGCSYTTDSIFVEFVEPKAKLGNDTILCKREELILSNKDLSILHPATKFLWSSGDTSSTIAPGDSGTYWLNIKVSHCEDTDSIKISYHIPENAALKIQKTDTAFCLSGILDAGKSEWNNFYLWNTGENTQSILVTEGGNYEVYVENECTEAISNFNVFVEGLEEGLNDYNIFSPNADGVNDIFSIYEGNREEYQLQIYNRWGKLIWETKNPQQHWTGDNTSDGLYYYHLNFKNCLGNTIEKKGIIEIIR